MTTLELRDVTVRYGTGRRTLTAVDGVSLEVGAGRIVGLVGESGSGKSTLAAAAVGLAPVSSGRVVLGGVDVTDARGTLAQRRRRIQLVFQDPYSSLDPRMAVGDSVAEALPRRRGERWQARRRDDWGRVHRLLQQVDLDPDLAGSLPSMLSGGQRQRVALARALAAEPEVVIADEITSSLDVSVQGAVLNLVRNLRDELGLSILFVSHNLAVVRYVSDVVAVMNLGRVVEIGPAADVLSAPRHPYTRSLLAAVAHLGGPGSTPTYRQLDDSEPPDPRHPPSGCRFHPRCPVGPLVNPDRTACVELDPRIDTGDRAHRAACHFVDSPEG